MYFVLFRSNGTAFVPAQHYYNVQISVRAKYVSQGVSKAKGIKLYWWYLVCTTLHTPHSTCMPLLLLHTTCTPRAAPHRAPGAPTGL